MTIELVPLFLVGSSLVGAIEGLIFGVERGFSPRDLLAPPQGVVEELLFRWLPWLYLGFWGIFGFTGLWVVLHPPKHWVSLTIIGICFAWLWMNGLGWLAMAVHGLANVAMIFTKLRWLKEATEA